MHKSLLESGGKDKVSILRFEIDSIKEM